MDTRQRSSLSYATLQGVLEKDGDSVCAAGLRVPGPLRRGIEERSMINTLYLPELREMLERRDEPALREFCTALHPARTAEFMEGLSASEAW